MCSVFCSLDNSKYSIKQLENSKSKAEQRRMKMFVLFYPTSTLCSSLIPISWDCANRTRPGNPWNGLKLDMLHAACTSRPSFLESISSHEIACKFSLAEAEIVALATIFDSFHDVNIRLVKKTTTPENVWMLVLFHYWITNFLVQRNTNLWWPQHI